MQENDRIQFGEIITVLSEIYDKKLSPAAVGLYWNTLKAYSISDVKQAAEHIIQTKTFNKFPLPADFIEYISPPELLETKALDAFNTIDRNFDDNGYSSIVFDDPVIHLVINALGGWIRVCQDTAVMDDRDYKFWRIDFLKIYQNYARQYSKNPDVPIPRLIGTFEKHNQSKGYIDENEMLLLPEGKKVPTNYISAFEEKHGRKQIAEGEKLKRLT